MRKNPELHKDRVLDTFWKEADALMMEEEQSLTEGARTLNGKRAKTPKNSKGSKTAAPSGLSTECHQDVLMACTLALFVQPSIV